MATARRRQAVQDEGLDETPEDAQGYRQGSVSEADLRAQVTVDVAKRLGWRPQEEWNRDPAKWVDAETFIQNTPREIEALKESRKRVAQAADAAIEDARRRGREEAQARLDAAVEEGDKEAARQAAAKVAEHSGPHPATEAWIGRNAWFRADPDAQGFAVSVINRLAAQGQSIEDQLETAEAAVRKRFPEHFGSVVTRQADDGEAEQRQQRREVPLSEMRQAPVTAPGTRTGASQPKKKGFADIPPADQALYRKYFAQKFQNRGRTAEEAQAAYAANYWANQGEE